MTLSTTTLALIGLIGAVWLAVAVAMTLRGLAMQRAAAFSARQTARLNALIETSPAVPMLVRADWRIEAPGRVGAMLGLDEAPQGFDALTQGDMGLNPGDFESLRRAVLSAQRGGKPFVLTLSPSGSTRSLSAHGGPAGPSLGGPGSVLVWLSDTTSFDQLLMHASRDRAEAVRAFDSLSSLIEAAPFPMWFRDTDCDITLVNRAYVDATEAASAESAVHARTELVEPVGGLSAKDAATVAQATDEIQARTVPVTVGGQRRMMQVVDVPIAGIGVAGYAIDIQELENTRLENRRFAAAQRALIERLSAAVAHFGSDRVLRFANQPFQRLFEIDDAMVQERVVFSQFLDHLRDRARVPDVRDFPAWKADRNAWFNATEAEEEEWLLRDGSHLRVVAHPTPYGGLLLIVEDRTEQVQLASTRDTLLRVRTATFDNLFEAIAVFAPDGRLHLWNQRFRRLWDAEEGLLATHPRVDALMTALADRLLKPQQVTVMQEVVRAATRDRQNRAGQVMFADGRQFDFAAIPLPDGNALLIMLDVTDSRRMEAALRERNEALVTADEVKTAFLSRMSYELRTPLTSIGGFAEMLASGYAGELPDSARSYVANILASVDVLGRHIDNVLDLAQAEAGTLAIERAPVDVAAQIGAAVDRIRPLAVGEGVELAVEWGTAPGVINGDARRVAQLLDQLLDNAVRYTAAARKRHPRVLVFADRGDDAVELIVSDNGPGLSPDMAAVADGAVGGTRRGGIGLALVRQLVVAHGGQMDAMSEAGQGTVIRVTLPIDGAPA